MASIVPSYTLFRNIELVRIFEKSGAAEPWAAGDIIGTGNTARATRRIPETEITAGAAIAILHARRAADTGALVGIQLGIGVDAVHTIMHVLE